MKKLILFLVVLNLLLSYNSNKDNLNTNNILSKYSEEDNIKYICSYNFCDYLRSDNLKRSIEIFKDKYIKSIKNDDIKNTLKVKGIKITKIVFKD